MRKFSFLCLVLWLAIPAVAQLDLFVNDRGQYQALLLDSSWKKLDIKVDEAALKYQSKFADAMNNPDSDIVVYFLKTGDGVNNTHFISNRDIKVLHYFPDLKRLRLIESSQINVVGYKHYLGYVLFLALLLTCGLYLYIYRMKKTNLLFNMLLIVLAIYILIQALVGLIFVVSSLMTLFQLVVSRGNLVFGFIILITSCAASLALQNIMSGSKNKERTSGKPKPYEFKSSDNKALLMVLIMTIIQLLSFYLIF